MSNYFKISRHNPFRFINKDFMDVKTIHFHDNWASDQIRPHEMIKRYKQKWNRADTTPLQVEGTIAPNNLILYDLNKNVVKSFVWEVVFTGINYNIYQTTFDVTEDVPDGFYFLFQRINLLEIDWAAWSEPIHIKDNHSQTLKIDYRNSYNAWDVAFSTGLTFTFRVEGDFIIPDFTADRERTTMVDQETKIRTLNAEPHSIYPMAIGGPDAIPPWVLDKMNRIVCCSSIKINGNYYLPDEGAKFEKAYVKGNPFIYQVVMDMRPIDDEMSLGFSSDVTLAPGLIAAYNINTNFFGPASTIPVIQIDHND